MKVSFPSMRDAAIAIATAAPVAPALVTLLTSLRRRCQVFALADDAPPYDAIVAAQPTLRVPPGVPLAVWVSSVDELAAPLLEVAKVVVTDNQEVIDAVGGRGLFASCGHAASGASPVAPFVRSRLRQARGLPPSPIVELGPEGWRWNDDVAIEGGLVETALGCAAAVVITGELILKAFAWGAPTVTNPATARQVAAIPGREVLVAETTEERRRMARSLAVDDPLAARLSWHGRALVERYHDASWAAAKLAQALIQGDSSLMPGPPPMATRLEALNTPASSYIVDRALYATRIIS